MELPAKYDPALTEDKWYAYWLENKFFHSEPDEREPYTVVIPPPNVTGILHMGHVLNNTLNDVLVRKARMDGKNACWVPGTDHASIATESKVVAKLAAEGIKKEDLTREEFLKHAWEWKEKHGGIILSQLRKLGASCDWDRTKFTMDPELSDAVINTFVYFYNKGYIYRGVRMVNWDPVGLTAVSDEEVIHKDTTSHFYHLRYFISDGNGNPTDKYLIIATTRPETIMADAAVCVNPADERYHWLKGKKVIVVLNMGSPMEVVSWRDKVDAILYLGYAGQGSGTALAKVLTGAVNPSAKTAMTWPVSYDSTPAADYFPGSAIDVTYYEDIYVGYRYYETFGVDVAFPFGFGLSYTAFTYSDPVFTQKKNGNITVSVTVTNTGDTAGREIVQCYVTKPETLNDLANQIFHSVESED